MKFALRPQIPLSLLLLFLTGCAEQSGQINSLKDQIASTREANKEATVKLQEINQQVAALKRQNSSLAAQRSEFEAQAAKSAKTEKTLINYRAEVENSLRDYTGAVAAYRKKYLIP
jgi:septal ring factor EnvC (AmiA/AmiB activator)